MVELGYVFTAIAIGSTFIAAWLVNSHWARKLEKGKKKYEVKAEMYSGVYDNLESLLAFERAMTLYDLVERRIEGGEEPQGIASNVETDMLIIEYLASLDTLVTSVEGDVDKGLLKDLSEKTFMGMAIDEIENIEKEEMIERMKDTMEKHHLDLTRCFAIIMMRLDKSLNRIKLMGAREAAQQIERVIGGAMAQAFSDYYSASGKNALEEELDRRHGDWASLMRTVEANLENDLEKTL